MKQQIKTIQEHPGTLEIRLNDPAAYAAMAQAVNPYGDGAACCRIAQAILWQFGRTNLRPEDYRGA